MVENLASREISLWMAAKFPVLKLSFVVSKYSTTCVNF